MKSENTVIRQTLELLAWIEKYGPEVTEKELAVAQGRVEILIWA